MSDLLKLFSSSAVATHQPFDPSPEPDGAHSIRPAAATFEPSLIIIRIPEVEKITGLARPTIYKRLKDDPTFPRPIPLSNSNARGAPVGFVLAEVQQWVRSRIALRAGAV